MTVYQISIDSIEETFNTLVEIKVWIGEMKAINPWMVGREACITPATKDANGRVHLIPSKQIWTTISA